MGFHEFWKRRIERCKIDLVIEGHKLYNPEQLYKIFVNEQWAARYIEKQKLRSWEELVAHVEEREEYEKDKRNGIGYVW